MAQQYEFINTKNMNTITTINCQTGKITEREMTPEEIAEMEAMNAKMEALQNQVPEKITKLQLKIQLVKMGFDLQIIENAIKTLPEPQKTLAFLSWTEATNFYRDNEMIANVGQMLNLTNEQIDELFINADKIRL